MVAEESWKQYGITVTRTSELSEATPQTAGMQRRAGIDRSNSMTQGLWVGRVSSPPGFSSGAHHHGEAETVGMVLAGTARIHYGEGLAEYFDMEEGDFVYIPPFLPHVESNLSPDQPVEFVTIRRPDNIVVNLENE